MNIKNLVIAVTILSVSSCASKNLADVNADIVGNDSALVANNDKVENSKQRISPLTEEEAVNFESDSALSGKAYFAFDSDLLTEEGKHLLDDIVVLLKDEKSILLAVEGYCDERGTKAYNLALGARRAESVKSYLVAAGVSAKRLTTVSYGEEKPVSVGITSSDYAKNRRVEFKIQ